MLFIMFGKRRYHNYKTLNDKYETHFICICTIKKHYGQSKLNHNLVIFFNKHLRTPTNKQNNNWSISLVVSVCVFQVQAYKSYMHVKDL